MKKREIFFFLEWYLCLGYLRPSAERGRFSFCSHLASVITCSYKAPPSSQRKILVFLFLAQCLCFYVLARYPKQKSIDFIFWPACFCKVSSVKSGSCVLFSGCSYITALFRNLDFPFSFYPINIMQAQGFRYFTGFFFCY